MQPAKTATISLRPKRQLTLPRAACEELGVEPGDRLELWLEDGTLRLKPVKAAALDALSEIREAFQRSRMDEEELLEAGKRARKTLYKEPRGGR